jgi:hypothetical protein
MELRRRTEKEHLWSPGFVNNTLKYTTRKGKESSLIFFTKPLSFIYGNMHIKVIAWNRVLPGEVSVVHIKVIAWNRVLPGEVSIVHIKVIAWNTVLPGEVSFLHCAKKLLPFVEYQTSFPFSKQPNMNRILS